VVLSRSDYICKEDLSFIIAEDSKESISGAGLENISLSKVEETAILSTLESAGGNKSETARRLGITRKTLLNKLARYRASF
jgi:two-component system response regulator HydG